MSTSRILSDPTFVSTTGTTAVGKHVPNIPAWRATLGATYRPNDCWAFTAAMRYSSKQYSTLDNTDTVRNVFQSFDPLHRGRPARAVQILGDRDGEFRHR